MRNVWLVLVVCGVQLVAAEKGRDWKTGQVVESDQSTASLHTIASTDRNYLVRGTIGNSEQALAVGASVRFAVEDKTMFLSLEGKEYRLYVLGERVATSAKLAPEAAKPTTQTAKSVTGPAKPAAEAHESLTNAPDTVPNSVPNIVPNNVLDNDAVVKMILGDLKEDTVVRVIETRPGKYTLTKDALAALRAAGVPQSVIAAMSAKMAAKR
jgi:hypothetical protein